MFGSDMPRSSDASSASLKLFSSVAGRLADDGEA